MSPHGVYRCHGDDEWIAIACETDADWTALAGMLGLEAGWSLHDRQSRCQEIDNAISLFTQTFDKTSLAEKLQQRGIPAGPVNNVPDMVADPQVQARGFFVPYERFDTPMPGTPIKMEGVEPETWTACPDLGADNEEVLKDWLRLSSQEIKNLVDASVLHDKPPA